MTNSRAKGARGERALANYLKEHGYDARRGQQYSGANGDADVVGLPGIHIECKWVEKVTPSMMADYMKQSMNDANYNEIPVVIHKQNRRGWKVTMNAGDLVQMVSRDTRIWGGTIKVTLDLDDFLTIYEEWANDK